MSTWDTVLIPSLGECFLRHSWVVTSKELTRRLQYCAASWGPKTSALGLRMVHFFASCVAVFVSCTHPAGSRPDDLQSRSSKQSRLSSVLRGRQDRDNPSLCVFPNDLPRSISQGLVRSRRTAGGDSWLGGNPGHRLHIVTCRIMQSLKAREAVC